MESAESSSSTVKVNKLTRDELKNNMVETEVILNILNMKDLNLSNIAFQYYSQFVEVDRN